ncbi:MAG: hypothetical protein G8D28_03725 [gamma proteobacterium symbiont of Phacoides pectinatus]
MRRQSDRQRGAVLVISLVILLILTIIGVSAVRTSALDARIVANLAEDRTAYQVAETGIELQIQKVSVSEISRAPMWPQTRPIRRRLPRGI